MAEPTNATPPDRSTDQLRERMDAFGREAQATGQRLGREAQIAGERLGRQAQAAGERFANDPGVIAAGTWIARVWGLVLIAIGLWFFGVFTLGYDLPALDWNLIWPLGLVLVGAFIVTTGIARRR